MLPAIIKKLDITEPAVKPALPLLSQNISIIEAGAHSEIFVKLLNFLGLIKVLVLTDFDCCSADGHHPKVKYQHGQNQVTSNTALKFFFGNGANCDTLVAKTENDKRFVWNNVNEKMTVNNDGTYMVCFQIAENGYQPRSFEDDFMALNKDFVLDKDFTERAIKPGFKVGFNAVNMAYEAAENVDSKATFAFEILLNSSEIALENGNKDPFGGWTIPSYIKEGLLWLRR